MSLDDEILRGVYLKRCATSSKAAKTGRKPPSLYIKLDSRGLVNARDLGLVVA